VLPDSQENQNLFLETLKQEYLQKAPLLQNKEVVSVYFGGGTPSLLSPEAIKNILSWISPLSPNCEITLEVNPEKLSLEKMQSFHKAGINRVSIGVQSFDDELLKILGRTHDSDTAKQAILTTLSAGITNISIDLMYELPHQTMQKWKHSVEEAAKLPITHLSLYNLTFEPNTSFFAKQKSLSKHLPSSEEAHAMLEYATYTFPKNGLHRYEISAFTRNHQSSVHNTGYWTARPFLGLGPSAFSYFEHRRFRNISHLRKWREKVLSYSPPEDFEEILDPISRQKELLAVELRLIQGVHLPSFIEKQGPLSSDLEQSIFTSIQEGYLCKKDDLLCLTDKGLLFYDTVASDLI
jgi:oxygen-independent coproporphyrinogen-3 oxidase